MWSPCPWLATFSLRRTAAISAKILVPKKEARKEQGLVWRGHEDKDTDDQSPEDTSTTDVLSPGPNFRGEKKWELCIRQ
jgi:hypothetical protein